MKVMKESVKQFIIEEHANACSEWKQKIEEKYPKLFMPEIEVGKWYKNADSEAIIFINSLDNPEENYGVGNNGRDWVSSYTVRGSRLEKYTPATDKEVEIVLLREAKKRGFKEGVEYKSAWTGGICHYPDPVFYNPTKNCLATYSSNECIFQNGKWAEIIEQESTQEQDCSRDISKIEAQLESIEKILTEIKLKL